MPDSGGDLSRELDPQKWSDILDDTSPEGSRFIFQRTIELAFESCESIIRPEQRWLDLGCGTGHLAYRLAMTGATVVGIDHDARMVEFARHRWSASMPRRRLQWVLSSAEHLPIGDGTIDGVVATSLAGYLPATRLLLGEMRRVLRPNGYAVISFTNRASFLLKLNHAAARWTAARSGSRPDRDYHLQAVASLAQEMGDVGLSVVQIRCYNFVLHVGNRLIPPPLLARRMERFGGLKLSRWIARNFVVVACKY